MQDVTSRLHPYLISVQVIDKQGGLDECHLELDDRNAELIVPPDGVMMTVSLGWSGEGPRLFDSGRRGIKEIGEGGFGQGPIPISKEEIDQEFRFGGPGLRVVFHGWVDEVESGFGRRGGGRRMWVGAKGVAGKGAAKEMQQGHQGEGKPEDGQEGQKIPLKDMMGKVFGSAGLGVALSPAMEKISRDYWGWNDSPMNLGKRLADELGGVFKISGNMAALVGKGEGVNAKGTAMPTIEAIWGINLIGWRIKPFVSRPQYEKGQAKFFDLAKGLYDKASTAIGKGSNGPFGGASAVANAIGTVVDQTQGKQLTTGTGKNAEMDRGIGWVLLNGEPDVKVGATIIISGARPGIDGSYEVTEAEHNYTRGVGYTTRANVAAPRPKGGYETWKQNTGAPVVAPGDPSFIGPIPFPEPPDIPLNEHILTDSELWRWREVERLREEQRQQQQNGLLPITRDELPLDGKVPEGYYLVGPPPDPPVAPPDVQVPISGDQTFTAQEMEMIRQGRNEEIQRQRDINAKVDEAMKEMDKADAARQEEIKKEVGDLLDQLKPGGKLPVSGGDQFGDDQGF
jgi:phage protein D